MPEQTKYDGYEEFHVPLYPNVSVCYCPDEMDDPNDGWVRITQNGVEMEITESNLRQIFHHVEQMSMKYS